MTMVERLRSKVLYKYELYLIKILPAIMAGLCLLNTVLSYFCIDLPILSYIGGISFLPLCFFYLSSIVFKFCIYHRLFIHYIALNWVMNIYDLYIGIPCGDRTLLSIYLIITGIFIFLIVYFRQKAKKNGYKKILCENTQRNC